MKKKAPVVLLGNKSETLGNSKKYPLVRIFKKGVLGKDVCPYCARKSTREVGLGKYGQVCCEDHIEEAAEYTWQIACAIARGEGYGATEEEILRFCQDQTKDIKSDRDTRIV